MVLAIWIYLLVARGRFWQATDRDDEMVPWSGPWPAIMAIIPARDEALCVGETVASLLGQTYPGELRVVVVDDQSRDATAQVAREAAAKLGRSDRLVVLSGRDLP
ncbi:MAG: glycosyltransferase, partial [Xanthobacteraceae bacterium]